MTKKSTKQEKTRVFFELHFIEGKMRVENQTKTLVWEDLSLCPETSTKNMLFKNSISGYTTTTVYNKRWPDRIFSPVIIPEVQEVGLCWAQWEGRWWWTGQPGTEPLVPASYSAYQSLGQGLQARPTDPSSFPPYWPAADSSCLRCSSRDVCFRYRFRYCFRYRFRCSFRYRFRPPHPQLQRVHRPWAQGWQLVFLPLRLRNINV